MEKTEKLRSPVLIAMKGHPGTGKSIIAASLRCPLMDKDDIRDATLSLSSTATFSAHNDLSYDDWWRVASTQVCLGLSVVIDSPISRSHHADTVLRIDGASYRVLVVECKPSDLAEWRRRLEMRGAEDGGVGHKPATWQDMERLLKGYDGCTKYDVGDVPKLIT